MQTKSANNEALQKEVAFYLENLKKKYLIRTETHKLLLDDIKQLT